MLAFLKNAFVSAMLVPLTSFGHHSAFGRFDTDNIIEIEGEVIEVFWRNPHATVIIESTEPNGGRVTWAVEGNSPNRLQRSGIRADSIRVGDRVKAAGWPPLTSATEIFATNLLLPSGEELYLLESAVPRWAAQGTGDSSFLYETEGDSSRPELGLFRVWSHTFVIPFLFPGTTDPGFDVYSYPMTEAALNAVQQYDAAADNPTQNCMPKGMPLIMEQPYPMEIVRDGGNIRIEIEEYDLVRSVHMDQAAVPAGEPASLLGYSIGRWDGTALVVTTTNLNWPWFNQLGIPQSEESVLVERFTPTEEGSRLDYELTVTDPANFAEPVTLKKHWLYLPGSQVLPYECEERN